MGRRGVEGEGGVGGGDGKERSGGEGWGRGWR